MDYRHKEFQKKQYRFTSNRCSTKELAMGQILEITKHKNNVVWSNKLLIGKTKPNLISCILEQPTGKLVLLVDAENEVQPDKEPKMIEQDVSTSWGEPDEKKVWWKKVKCLMERHYFQNKVSYFKSCQLFKLLWWNFVYA